MTLLAVGELALIFVTVAVIIGIGFYVCLAFNLHPDRVVVRLWHRFIAAVYARFPFLCAVNRKHVDTRAKCPACGVRKRHVVTWNAITRFIEHTCGQCKAVFAEDPVKKPDEWQKKAIPEAEK